MAVETIIRYNGFPQATRRIQMAVTKGVAAMTRDIARLAQGFARVDTGEMRSKIVASGNAVHATAGHTAFNEWGTVHMAAQPMLRPAAAQVFAKAASYIKVGGLGGGALSGSTAPGDTPYYGDVGASVVTG